MKKNVKWLVCLLTAIGVAGSVALSACNNDNDDDNDATHTTHVDADNDGKCDECGADMGSAGTDPDENPDDGDEQTPEYLTPEKSDEYWAELAETKGNLLKENAAEKEVAYQFAATYTQEGAGTYYVLMNLYADGYVRVYQYRGFLFEYGGYWVNDGEDMGLWVGALEYGLDNGGVQVYSYDYSNNLTYDSNNTFTFTFSISLGAADGGLYVRSVEFNNLSGEVAYETTQDWIDYVEEETGETFEELDFSGWTGNVVKETLVSVSMTDKDGTSRDVKFYAENEYDFGGLGGSWQISGGELAITQETDNGAEWTVTGNADGSYTLTYYYHNAEGTVFTGTLSAEDFAALTASQVTATVTLYFGGNTESTVTQTVEFLSDGTYSAAGGQMTGTWKAENGVLTLTGALSYDAETKALTLSAGTYSFSAVLSADEQDELGLVVALATVTLYFGGNTESTVTQTVEFLNSGNYSAAGGQMTGTWKVENGVLTLTGALSYDAATKALTLSAGAYSFSAVLSAEQIAALGLAA